ncbi:hypothetical protein JCM10212_004344, partial [Sporobolomyces blumeae]
MSRPPRRRDPSMTTTSPRALPPHLAHPRPPPSSPASARLDSNSESALLQAAGGPEAFAPRQDGTPGQGTSKVGTGWKLLGGADKAQDAPRTQPVSFDDYEDDPRTNVNPGRRTTNNNSARSIPANDAARSTASSRWASAAPVEVPPPPLSPAREIPSTLSPPPLCSQRPRAPLGVTPPRPPSRRTAASPSPTRSSSSSSSSVDSIFNPQTPPHPVVQNGRYPRPLPGVVSSQFASFPPPPASPEPPDTGVFSGLPPRGRYPARRNPWIPPLPSPKLEAVEATIASADPRSSTAPRLVLPSRLEFFSSNEITEPPTASAAPLPRPVPEPASVAPAPPSIPPASNSRSASPSIPRAATPQLATASRQPLGPTRTGSGHFQQPAPPRESPLATPLASPSLSTTTAPTTTTATRGAPRPDPVRPPSQRGQPRNATNSDSTSSGKGSNGRNLPPNKVVQNGPSNSRWATAAPSSPSMSPSSALTRAGSSAREGGSPPRERPQPRDANPSASAVSQAPAPSPGSASSPTNARPSSSFSRPPASSPPVPTSISAAPTPAATHAPPSPASHPKPTSTSSPHATAQPSLAPTANAVTPQRNSRADSSAALSSPLLRPDRNRVNSGGMRKEKKTPEELDALMARMKLKNEEARVKREKAERDRLAFEKVAEEELKRSEELKRLVREEKERVRREEQERRDRTEA